MKRRWITALIAAVMVLQGCDYGEYNGETVKVYYIRDISGPVSESAIGAVNMPAARYSDKARTAMTYLLSDPGEGDLESPYPEGVAIESITYDGDTLTVDLSEEYGEMYGAELAAADACAVMTLCGIDGISAVRFTVKGKPHPLHEKEFLSKEDIITDDLSLKPVEMQAVLYFSDGNVDYVVPELKNIIIRENEPIERYIIEELIKGPTEEYYQRILDPDTELISISRENKICYVNFSHDFKDGFDGDLVRELQTLYSVTNTLCSIEGIEGVQYLVEGDPIYGDTVMRKVDEVVGAYSEQTINAAIYLPDSTGEKLVKVPTRIKNDGGFYIERLVVEKLIAGIDGFGFMSIIPKGTMLLGLEVSKNTCVVNFSKEFVANDSGDIGREIIYQAIALSLNEANSNIEKIRIKVNGFNLTDGINVYPDKSIVFGD